MTDAALTPPPETERRAKKRFLRPIPPVPSLPPLRRWDKWDTATFVVLGIVAALTRFIGLAAKTDNGTPLFDEKHYVPQAWQILESTRDPISSGIEDNPGYGLIVHPPVAKQVIALGEWIFGYSPMGWRFMSAVCGLSLIHI